MFDLEELDELVKEHQDEIAYLVEDIAELDAVVSHHSKVMGKIFENQQRIETLLVKILEKFV